MPKRSVSITLLIATRNAHKVGEIRAILGAGFDYLTLNDFPGAPAVIEDAATFAGNATKKAVELARWLSTTKNLTPMNRERAPMNRERAPMNRERAPMNRELELKTKNCSVLADDSGLEVDALNGAPGVHSARFAALDSGRAGNSTDEDNMAKLLRLLKDVPVEKRTARFRCVIALTPIIAAGPVASSPVCAANEFELQTELFDGVCEGRIGFAPRGAKGFGYDPLFVPDGFELTFAEIGEATKNRLSHRAGALWKLQKRFSRRV